MAGIGSAAGGIAGQAVLDIGGQFNQWGLNAMSASKAWDRWKNSQTRGPTYAMSGLRKAGLNPILAAGAGGFSGTSRPGAPQASGVSKSNSSFSPLVFSQAEKLRKEMDLIENQGTLADEQATALRLRNDFYKAHPDVLSDDIRNSSLPNSAEAAAIKLIRTLYNEYFGKEPDQPQGPPTSGRGATRKRETDSRAPRKRTPSKDQPRSSRKNTRNRERGQ